MLHDISQDDLQAFGVRCSLETLCDFRSHSGIGFTGDYAFGLFEDFGRQVSSSGADFEDDLRAGVRDCDVKVVEQVSYVHLIVSGLPCRRLPGLHPGS